MIKRVTLLTSDSATVCGSCRNARCVTIPEDFEARVCVKPNPDHDGLDCSDYEIEEVGLYDRVKW